MPTYMMRDGLLMDQTICTQTLQMSALSLNPLNGYIEVGLFRLPAVDFEGRWADFGLLTIYTTDTSFVVEEDWNEELGEEDWNTLAGEDDWGKNIVGMGYDVVHKTSVGGSKVFNAITPEIYKETSRAKTLAIQEPGGFHKIRLDTPTTQQTFHLQSLGLDGILVGRH